MDFNTIAEVLIGLAVLYWLVSTVASWMVELIQTLVLNKRAEILKLSIGHMLDGLVANQTFAAAFYQHPLIQSLFKDTKLKGTTPDAPSFISADTFSKVLIDLMISTYETQLAGPLAAALEDGEGPLADLKEKWEVIKQKLPSGGNWSISTALAELNSFLDEIKSLPPNAEFPSVESARMLATRLRDFTGGSQMSRIQAVITDPAAEVPQVLATALRPLFARANHDIYQLHHEIGRWFDSSMDRAAGWYKRNTMSKLFLTGLVVAFSFNIDSIRIGEALFSSPSLRTEAVKLAVSATSTPYGVSAIPQQLMFREFLESPLCRAIKLDIDNDVKAMLETSTSNSTDDRPSRIPTNSDRFCIEGLMELTLRSKALVGIAPSLAPDQFNKERVDQAVDRVRREVCAGASRIREPVATEKGKESLPDNCALRLVTESRKCKNAECSGSCSSEMLANFWSDPDIVWATELGTKYGELDRDTSDYSSLIRPLATVRAVAEGGSFTARSYLTKLPGVGEPGWKKFGELLSSKTLKGWQLFFAFALLILGWILTGLAVMFGAPFWFDLMGKLVNVRSTGEKPEPSTTAAG